MLQARLLLSVLLIFVIFLVAGCASPPVTTSIPQSSAPSATPISPSLSSPSATTPISTMVLATNVNDILGTWEGIGAEGVFIRFNADGTCQIAQTLEKLTSTPDVEASFTFDGTNFTILEVSTSGLASGLSSCGSRPGTYQIQLLATGNIKFLKVLDACSPRLRSMTREHRPVR